MKPKLTLLLLIITGSTISFGATSTPAVPTVKKAKSTKLGLAEPVNPVALSYWTGWGNNTIPDQGFDGILLSFAILNFNGDSIYTSYEKSGNFQDPAQKGSMYNIWHSWASKYKKPAMVSFGGGTNPDVRSYIINASDKQLICSIIQPNTFN